MEGIHLFFFLGINGKYTDLSGISPCATTDMTPISQSTKGSVVMYFFTTIKDLSQVAIMALLVRDLGSVCVMIYCWVKKTKRNIGRWIWIITLMILHYP